MECGGELKTQNRSTATRKTDRPEDPQAPTAAAQLQARLPSPQPTHPFVEHRGPRLIRVFPKSALTVRAQQVAGIRWPPPTPDGELP